jgi:hypothetical protein
VRTLPGMQGDHALPRKIVATELAAATASPAADTHQGAQPRTDSVATVAGSEADESESESEIETKDKATRKRKRAARNKESRQLARKRKVEAAKAALSKEYSAGAPRTLGELRSEISQHADENGNTSLGLGVRLMLPTHDEVLKHLAEYHKVNNLLYVKSGFCTTDADGIEHKMNAYVHTDGLAVYCRHCSKVRWS